MHMFIESADDVIALTVSEKLTGAELDAIMDQLEAKMARHEKVHIFVETRAIHGVELSGLPSYMARAMPLFGKLKHFGRVAVVADQAWVRVATRIESALLPFISYRVFLPEERDEALAWVRGEAPRTE
ncbi:MAG TPA: STAS/SEC14 domain-containing protein [Allosphingosinicella sp.]